MYDDQTVYTAPGQASKKFGGPVQKNKKGEFFVQTHRNDRDIGEKMIDPAVYGFTNPLVERLPLGRKDSAPARDAYTPPEGNQPAPWSKTYGAYSLNEDAPKPPQVNTYDVWSRKDTPPSRNSYTPPPLEEGAKPTPAPWNKAYSQR